MNMFNKKLKNRIKYLEEDVWRLQKLLAKYGEMVNDKDLEIKDRDAIIESQAMLLECFSHYIVLLSAEPKKVKKIKVKKGEKYGKKK